MDQKEVANGRQKMRKFIKFHTIVFLALNQNDQKILHQHYILNIVLVLVMTLQLKDLFCTHLNEQNQIITSHVLLHLLTLIDKHASNG